MLLTTFTLVLEPVNPLQFSIAELRSYFTGTLGEYTALHKHTPAGFLHRYPALQCKQLKNSLMVIGIRQGATFLESLANEHKEIAPGKNACTILSRDPAIREAEFGVGDTPLMYEILTPWLALNQQNNKKFYDLKGKPPRDAFMHKILGENLRVLAKSLDYTPPMPITCEARLKFRIDRIEHENVIVFLGKFRTNLRIPDYFGMGQAVSQGFGTIRCMHDPVPDDGVQPPQTPD